MRIQPVATLLLIALLRAPAALAGFGDYVAHELDGATLVIRSDVGELRLTAIDDAAFEVHYLETGLRQLPSFALKDELRPASASLADESDRLVFAVPDLTAVVHKSPLSLEFLRDGQSLLAEEHGYFAYDTVRGFRFRLDEGEKILGGGMRVLGMDRRGERMPLYNRAHYEYETHSSQMYYSLPAVMSTDRYAIVFDNSASGWLDIGHREADVLQFEAVGGRTAYLVVAGRSYPELIGNLTDVTGRQPLPPRWAFGNFASRYGYRSEDQVRDVVARFRREAIPLDTVILDLYWFGPDTRGYMGNLDWDRGAWPNAEAMIAELAGDGIGVIPVTEPYILTTSKNWQSAVDGRALARSPTGAPRRFEFFFGETGLVDVFDEAARDWFWAHYARLFKQGIAGIWGDLGEPEVHPADVLHRLGDGTEATADEVHNAFGHTWTQMLHDKLLQDYPQRRPFNLMRAGFIGTQRYGIVPWTGDVARRWGGLKPQVELSLQMGLFGLGYTHSDLGGFAEAKTLDDELYVRWLQYGVFQPVYRPHAPDYLPPEPVFRDEPTRDIVRRFIELRYRLLPYNYTLAWENSTTGMPLMRPLFFEDETDTALVDEKNAYLWGDAFLVAPVTDPGVDTAVVRLPPGAWFDYWSGRRYQGGTDAEIPVNLETIPVLVRAGAFVPMAELVQTTRNYSSERLQLHYYADESVTEAVGRMYEDNGASRTSLADGAYELLVFSAVQSDQRLRLSVSRDGGDYPGRPKERDLTLVVHNWRTPVDAVIFAGAAIPLGDRPPAQAPGAYFDAEENRLEVSVRWDHSPAELVVATRATTPAAGRSNVPAGEYADIHAHNLAAGNGYDERLFAFVRRDGDEQFIVVGNNDDVGGRALTIELPADIVDAWQLAPGRYALDETLGGRKHSELVVNQGLGRLYVNLAPRETLAYRLGETLFLPRLDRDTYLDDDANSGVVGTLVTWKNVASRFLESNRHVQIWLPPGYARDRHRRYPVIYMHDGQNLFDPRLSSWGMDWGVDETIVREAAAGRIEPAIVVGIWSTPGRSYEYSPWHGAEAYARFLTEELMPRVNREFRTRPGPASTFTLGASGGGLVAYYLVKEYPDVFGGCGCLSTGFTLSPAMIAVSDGAEPQSADRVPYIIRDIADGATVPPGTRFFFDYGTEGLDAEFGPAHQAVRDWLLGLGLAEGRDFMVQEVPGAGHNETAWRARLATHLRWLLAGDN